MKIAIKVIPRAGRQQVAIVAEGELRCHLQSAPEGGRANKELADLLAERLGIPKRSVAVVQGFASRVKVVEIIGFVDWQELAARLAKG